jgi:predicted  nucleic acid-binding Zn-ribbon protein
METDMEHDQQCHDQTRELALLKDRFLNLDATLREVVDRVQELVEQYHKQNIAQATMSEQIANMQKDVTAIKTTLESRVASREEHLTLRGQVWWGVGAIVLLFLTAVWGLVVKAGGKP